MAERNGAEPPLKKRKIDNNTVAAVEEEEEDEFEKYMREINATAGKQKKKAMQKQKEIELKSVEESIQATKKKEERVDLATETPMDAFIEQIQSTNTIFLPSRKGTDGYNSDEEVYNVAKYVNKLERDKKEHRHKLRNKKESELKYDDYGNIITPDRDRMIEELEPIDHSKIWYSKFNKNFYSPHPDIQQMTSEQVTALRQQYHIECKCNGKQDDSIKPVASFAYFAFDEKLMDIIIEQNFERPTPIQMQALPCLLSGRDVMGLAKTGSGKTAAFLWPLIPHILAQDKIEAGFDGPIAIILSPTRELASQTYKECRRYLSVFGMNTAPLFGGLNMYQQRQMMQSGVEVVVATPGRLIDLIKDNSTNCRRVTYIVIDEVDKMFSLGFESQIRSIIGQIRSDKQMAMFSATMNEKIEAIINDSMSADYVRVSIGNVHLSNADVQQYVEIVRDDSYKFEWLKTRIQLFIRNGLVIVFCSSKLKCEQLARELNNINVATACIHGDKLQNNRQQIIDQYKKKKYDVLVATDVVSRGLNIKQIQTVINYDCPHNMDSYIHRVGRTGRGGDTGGAAYTLLIPRGENDKKMAPKLLELLRKLRMLVAHTQLEQMVAGEFEHSRKKTSKLENGHRGHGDHSAKKHTGSLMSTFVKASKPDGGECDSATTADNATSSSSSPKKKRKTRWGN